MSDAATREQPGTPTPRDQRPTAIAAALVVNLAIAVAKFLGFVFTGAASMLAEAIHSVADTSNQLLLFLGRSRARRPPNPSHPFGYGRERYFWAFVVALVLFSAGGLFALLEAEEKLRRPHAVADVPWALAILVVALVLESLSLRTAMHQARATRTIRSWRHYIRQSKDAEVPVVLLEDTAAILGLSFAIAGVSLAAITGNGRFDALGSLGIGLLLVVVAFTLAAEMKSLLIGEAGAQGEIEAACEVLRAHGHVHDILELRTEQLGPRDLLVTGRVSMNRDLSGRALATALREIEAAIEAATDSRAHVYLTPVMVGSSADATSSVPT